MRVRGGPTGGAGEGWEAEKSQTERHARGIDRAPIHSSAVEPCSVSLTCNIRGPMRSADS